MPSALLDPLLEHRLVLGAEALEVEEDPAGAVEQEDLGGALDPELAGDAAAGIRHDGVALGDADRAQLLDALENLLRGAALPLDGDDLEALLAVRCLQAVEGLHRARRGRAAPIPEEDRHPAARDEVAERRPAGPAGRSP